MTMGSAWSESGIGWRPLSRRCHIEGAFAAVRRRGAEEAGAVFIKLNRLDGTAELTTPQTAFEGASVDARVRGCRSGEARRGHRSL